MSPLSNSAFTGGQDATTYTYVQQSDINNANQAAASLEGSLQQQAQASLNAQLQTGESLIGSTQCTPSVKSNHQAGDIASSVTASVSESCTSEAYNPNYAFPTAVSLFRSDVAHKDPSYKIIGQPTTMVQQVHGPDSKGIITLIVQAKGFEVFQFSNTYKQTLASLIAGKSEQDAQNLLLKKMGVKGVTIKLPQGTENILPTKPDQITINISSSS